MSLTLGLDNGIVGLLSFVVPVFFSSGDADNTEEGNGAVLSLYFCDRIGSFRFRLFTRDAESLATG